MREQFADERNFGEDGMRAVGTLGGNQVSQAVLCGCLASRKPRILTTVVLVAPGLAPAGPHVGEVGSHR